VTPQQARIAVDPSSEFLNQHTLAGTRLAADEHNLAGDGPRVTQMSRKFLNLSVAF
jgi:hypothetical protein